MTQAQKVEDLVDRLIGALPGGITELPRGIKDTMVGIINQNLEKLDLVSREEFLTQQKALASSEARLRKLEKRIAELEQQVTD